MLLKVEQMSSQILCKMTPASVNSMQMATRSNNDNGSLEYA